MQEAYHLPHSKYSFWCISWRVPHPKIGVPQDRIPPVLSWPGGYPILGCWVPVLGYPILTWQGVPHPRVGVPVLGYLHLELAGVTPPPVWTWPEYPLRRELGPVTGLPPERTWDQLKYYGMKMGYPPPSGCGQTDTCENSTFPSYYVRGR